MFTPFIITFRRGVVYQILVVRGNISEIFVVLAELPLSELFFFIGDCVILKRRAKIVE